MGAAAGHPAEPRCRLGCPAQLTCAGWQAHGDAAFPAAMRRHRPKPSNHCEPKSVSVGPSSQDVPYGRLCPTRTSQASYWYAIVDLDACLAPGPHGSGSAESPHPLRWLATGHIPPELHYLVALLWRRATVRVLGDWVAAATGALPARSGWPRWSDRRTRNAFTGCPDAVPAYPAAPESKR